MQQRPICRLPRAAGRSFFLFCEERLREQVVRLGSCSPMAGAPPCTRVTFSPMRKSPKNLQGLRPLESPSAESPPLLRSLTHRAGLPSATKIDRFATLRWWANRSFFSHQLSARRYFLLSIRGAAGRFSFCILPGVAPLSGGSNACVAGGMIMPPQGEHPEGNPLWEILW